MTFRKLLMVFTFVSLTAAGSLNANPTKPVIFDRGDGQPIKGWERDAQGKIKIKVWLDSMNDQQKRVFKLAMDQWVNWATADKSLSDSNYGGGKKNPDVMSGEPLETGTSGRNLSESDIGGMKQLYDGTTIEVTYVDEKSDSNYQAELSNTTDFGDGQWVDTDGDGDIDEGVVKIIDQLTGGNEWFYVTDSDGDGKITNKDKDAAGKSIGDYKRDISPTQYEYYMNDFYTLAKHEIGHTLGFDHSVTVPAPSAMLLAATGISVAGWLRRKKL